MVVLLFSCCRFLIATLARVTVGLTRSTPPRYCLLRKEERERGIEEEAGGLTMVEELVFEGDEGGAGG